MIQLEISTTYDIEEWRRHIDALNGGPLLLPEIWASECSGESLKYLVFKKGERIVGAALGIVMSKSLFGYFSISKNLFLPTVPAISRLSREDHDEIYEALIKFCRQEGYKNVTVDARWGDDFSQQRLFNKFVHDNLIEFVVDLRPDLDVILRGFHKKHRKNLRKAQTEKLLIVQDNSLDGVMALREMQQESSLRATGKGNPYQVQNKAAYQKIFDNVYSTGFGSILFAKSDEEYIASLAYLVFGKKAITVRSGAIPRGYDLYAMYLLQYELIERLKYQGVEELNIGGVPADAKEQWHPQHGLYDYKRYYGGKELLRTALKIEL